MVAYKRVLGLIFVMVILLSSFTPKLYVDCVGEYDRSSVPPHKWYYNYNYFKEGIYSCLDDSMRQMMWLEGDSLIRYYGKKNNDSLLIEMTLQAYKIGDQLYRVEWNGFSKDSLVRHAIYRNGYNRSKSEEMEMKIKALLPDFENRIVRFDTLSLVICRNISEENRCHIFEYNVWRYNGYRGWASNDSLFSKMMDHYYNVVWMPEEKYVFKDSPDRKITIQFSKPDLLFVKCDSGRFPFFEVYRVAGHIIKDLRGPRFRGHVDVVDKLFSTRDPVSERYVLPNEHILFDITESNIFPDLTGYTINHAIQSAWFDAFAVGPFLFLLQNE